MNKLIRRIKKRVVVKQLKVWQLDMEGTAERIRQIDRDLSNDSSLDDMTKNRLNQLKRFYQEEYNSALAEVNQLIAELKELS